jgi:hypothetical protein
VARRELDYDTEKDHEARLRKAFLHSADAIPDRVAAYLRGFTEPGRWRAREQLLRTFAPLVDHLAAEYVTFALRALIEDPEEDSYDPMGDFGIGGKFDYFPPAHGQGPFLRLLRTNEEEGLRLVHGLTNAATRTWQRHEQAGRNLGAARNPLPITIRLPAGPQEFWGDEAVYCWHRHTSVGPDAVISALMALEVWMEEQLELGRPGGELIGKVLAGSESVAVVAVCVGVSLAFPDSCLAAVLPLLANPRVWRMDIHRFHKDREGPPILPDPLGKYEFAYQQLRERNRCPQRRMEVRDLIHLGLFSDDPAVQAKFREAFRDFGNDLAFEYEGESDSEDAVRALREEVEGYREFLRAENYHEQQTDDGPVRVFRSPRAPSAADVERLTVAVHFNAWIQLDAWADQVQKSASSPGEADLERVVRAARSFHREGDFSEQPRRGPGMDSTRQQSIAAVAAAVACKAWPWALEYGYAEWCQRVLLAAARCPRDSNGLWDRRTVFHLDHKLAAARGLTALVAQGVDDPEVRGTILGLVLDTQMQVVRALFAGLRDVWGKDECLCHNCLSLALTFAVVSRDRVVPGHGPLLNEAGDAWLRGEWERHVAQLEAGVVPPLPKLVISDDVLFFWDLAAAALHALPLAELVQDPELRTGLIGMLDSLLAWTISRWEKKRGRASDVPIDWTNFFMGWIASLARHLTPDEIDCHILSAVRSSDSALPGVAAGLLYGCLQYLIGSLEPPTPEAERTWEQVCGLVLDAGGLARYVDGHYLPIEWGSAVTRIVFVTSGLYLYDPEWCHAPRFSRVIDRWVNVIGTNHTAYAALLTMLKNTGSRFSVGTVLGWMERTASRSKDLAALWRAHDNGQRTAEVLHSMWERSRAELRADSAAFGQFALLIDRLATHGVTLASVIQKQLEDVVEE